jgi:ribosomal protein L28
VTIKWEASVQTCLFERSVAISERPLQANQTKPSWVRDPMFPSLPSFAAALSQPFKRSQLGLFHGKTKQYGNNVPFSKKKTRRAWLPNIHSKRLFSDALGEMVRVKVSTRALKTIRKVCRALFLSFFLHISWRRTHIVFL